MQRPSAENQYDLAHGSHRAANAAIISLLSWSLRRRFKTENLAKAVKKKTKFINLAVRTWGYNGVECVVECRSTWYHIMAQGASGSLATLVTFAYWWNRGIPHTYYILLQQKPEEKLLKCQWHSRTRSVSHTDKSQGVVPPPTPQQHHHSSSFAFGHAHPWTRLERFEFKLALKFDHLGFELGLRFLQLLSSCYARCSKAWLIKKKGSSSGASWSSDSADKVCSRWLNGVRTVRVEVGARCLWMHTLQMTSTYALLLWPSTSLWIWEQHWIWKNFSCTNSWSLPHSQDETIHESGRGKEYLITASCILNISRYFKPGTFFLHVHNSPFQFFQSNLTIKGKIWKKNNWQGPMLSCQSCTNGIEYIVVAVRPPLHKYQLPAWRLPGHPFANRHVELSLQRSSTRAWTPCWNRVVPAFRSASATGRRRLIVRWKWHFSDASVFHRSIASLIASPALPICSACHAWVWKLGVLILLEFCNWFMAIRLVPRFAGAFRLSDFWFSFRGVPLLESEWLSFIRSWLELIAVSCCDICSSYPALPPWSSRKRKWQPTRCFVQRT